MNLKHQITRVLLHLVEKILEMSIREMIHGGNCNVSISNQGKICCMP